MLTALQRMRLRAIVEYLKTIHTRFIHLIEPQPPIVPEHWEIGVSEIGETTELH